MPADSEHRGSSYAVGVGRLCPCYVCHLQIFRWPKVATAHGAAGCLSAACRSACRSATLDDCIREVGGCWKGGVVKRRPRGA